MGRVGGEDAYIALERLAVVDGEAEHDGAARMVGVGEEVFVLFLRGPQRLAHSCCDIIGVPALDHEVTHVGWSKRR